MTYRGTLNNVCAVPQGSPVLAEVVPRLREALRNLEPDADRQCPADDPLDSSAISRDNGLGSREWGFGDLR